MIYLNLDLLCHFFLALVNWGSSSAWIGTYFLGPIEKTMIHRKLLRSLRSLGRFQCFEQCQHKCSSQFPFLLLVNVN